MKINKNLFDLKDYILVLENIVPSSLSKNILKEYKNSSEWTDPYIEVGKINKDQRNCNVIEISKNTTLLKNLENRKKIDEDIYTCIKQIILNYNQKFKYCRVSKDSGYNLLKYEKNNFYSEHVDSFTEIPRTLSCSLILNDEFKGGEFSFFNNEIIYNLKKGSAIIFPSNFLYPHSVLPIISGTRYSVVTWFL
jgi:predicted 2-oxoglutarate/Fe(II)-dependent dioxygenase YbiX